MKRFIIAVVAVIMMATGAMAADVQKAYLTGSVNASELDSIDKYSVEARAKIGLYKGFGIDTSAFYGIGDRADSTVIRTGVFFNPTSWSEISCSTEFGIYNVGNFGDGRLVKFSVGTGF